MYKYLIFYNNKRFVFYNQTVALAPKTVWFDLVRKSCSCMASILNNDTKTVKLKEVQNKPAAHP